MSSTRKVRLCFRKEHGGGTEKAGLCACDYSDIVKMAGTKLQIGKNVLSRARLVVEATGMELKPNDPNLSKVINNDSVIVVHISNRKTKNVSGEEKPVSDDTGILRTNRLLSLENDELLPPLAPSRRRDSSGAERLADKTIVERKTAEGMSSVPCKTTAEETTKELATKAHLGSTNTSLPLSTTPIACAPIQSELRFEGPFPVLENNILTLCRESVASCSSFTETDHGSYIVFDYKDASNSSATFPNPWGAHRKKHKERWLLALRRECRGLILCSTTGKVIRRPFHKFFNVNEVEETEQDDVQLTDDILLLEKVDGSLVSPLRLTGQQEILWVSRKALQPKLQKFCQAAESADYVGLARFCIDNGTTPLFEWCEAGQAVGVVRHDTSSVTLLAIRDVVTGAYATRRQVEDICRRFSVPCVRKLEQVVPRSMGTFSDMRDLVAQIAAQPAPLEGAVAILNHNTFFKIKTVWYVSMATASKRGGGKSSAFLQEFLKAHPSLEGMPRENVWKAALGDDPSTADDSRALWRGLLESKEQAEQLQKFCELCDEHVDLLHTHLCEWAKRVRDEVANSAVPVDIETVTARSVVRSGWSHKMLRAYLQEDAPATSHVRQDLLGERVEDLEYCFGLRWNYESVCVEMADTGGVTVSQRVDRRSPTFDDAKRHIVKSKLFPAAALDRAPKGLADHVCDVYLVRKVADYLGKTKAMVMDETRIEISDNYEGSEGKLKGMWEQFKKKNVVDLRINLQPCVHGPLSEHNGNADWALWLVQYGQCELKKRSQNKSVLESGEFAGAFMKTNCVYRFSDLRRGIWSSFQERRLVFLSPLEAVSKVPDKEEGTLGSKLGTTAVNGTNNAPWTIFVDLDGVLADFDGALLESSGKRAGDFPSSAAMWRHILSSKQNFFANLPWTEHGRDIWNLVHNATKLESVVEVKILSGVPDNRQGGKGVTRQKHSWCNEHLGKNVDVITCSSAEKFMWSGPKCVLIDDHLLHQEKWEAAGGSFLHYTGNFSRLQRQLRALAFPNGGFSIEELEALSRIRERASKRLEKDQRAFSIEESQVRYVDGSSLSMDELFASTVASLSDDSVGVACEWCPDELHKTAGALSSASAVQVAMRDMVFCIDMNDMTSSTKRGLIGLFSPPTKKAAWLLVFFKLDNDIHRIIAAVPEIASFYNPETAPTTLNLQVVCTGLDVSSSSSNFVSVSDAATVLAGCTLAQDQVVGKYNRSQRPLSAAKIQFAACDAQICLVVWEAIAREEVLRLLVLSSMTDPLTIPSKRMLQRYRTPGLGDESQTHEPNELTNDFANPAPLLSAPPIGAVEALYTGIFLDKDSARKLLSACTPRHRNILADHVTLSYAPLHDALAGLPVGQRYRLHVSETLYDEKSQLVRVSFVEGGAGLTNFLESQSTVHITISTAANVNASRSMEMLHQAKEVENVFVVSETVDSIILEGTVGVLSRLTTEQDTLASLTGSVRRKLTDFAERREPGTNLKFRGDELTSAERSAIHAFCESRGMVSRSDGPKDNRKMTLSFPKFASANEEDSTDNVGRIVSSALDLDEKTRKRGKAKQLYSREVTTTYLCVSRDVFGKTNWITQMEGQSNNSVMGELHINHSNDPEIHIDPERPEPADATSDEGLLQGLIRFGGLPSDTPRPVVVIMRGLPGSGKSSWARALQTCCGEDYKAVIVSADSFFEKKGTYADNFDRSALGEAHDFCRRRFIEALEDTENGIVIVDNTNSRKREYTYYIDQARGAGRRFLVVEMLCRSNDELQEFYHRGVHHVPIQDLGRMFGRWEADKQSLLFTSPKNGSPTV